MNYEILGRPWQDILLASFETVGLWVLVRDVLVGGTTANLYNLFWLFGNAAALAVAWSLGYWLDLVVCAGYTSVRAFVALGLFKRRSLHPGPDAVQPP